MNSYYFLIKDGNRAYSCITEGNKLGEAIHKVLDSLKINERIEDCWELK